MFKQLALTALAAVVCIGLPTWGQDALPEAAPAGPSFDPKAQEVFEAFQDYVANLGALTLDAAVSATITADGETQEGALTLDIALQRPGAIRIKAVAEESEATIGASGGEAYIYVPEISEYMTAPAPPELEHLVLSAAAGPLQTGATFIAELVAAQPYEQLMAEASAVRYVGEEELDGQACHRIEVTHQRIGWDMWIDAGDKPMLRRAVPNVQEWLTRQGEDSFEISMVAQVREWNAAPVFADGFFVFDPPEGVEKVENFGAPEPQASQQDAAHPLLGAEAPAFALPLLDGGEMDLAGHKGQDIVILDFWATWCSPCRTLMPIISDVARDYRDQNVVLYAVNVEEDEEQIRGFLEGLGLELATPLDKDGAVARLYQTMYLPQTVIVGKDGTVQAVHVGLSADIDRQLREELDVLAAGGSLSQGEEEAAVSE